MEVGWDRVGVVRAPRVEGCMEAQGQRRKKWEAHWAVEWWLEENKWEEQRRWGDRVVEQCRWGVVEHQVEENGLVLVEQQCGTFVGDAARVREREREVL